jgi:CDP-diglyceride synthetase
MEQMASIFETIMIISFGVSWPLSIVRSVKSRSTKGKSIFFMLFILIGYFCGLAAKFMTQTYNLAFWFYFPNIILVSTDICLYFRNKGIEKKQEAEISAED